MQRRCSKNWERSKAKGKSEKAKREKAEGKKSKMTKVNPAKQKRGTAKNAESIKAKVKK